MAHKDAQGDKIKQFEMAEAGRKTIPGLPIIARLDGKAFHTFTKGLERPYDARLTQLMVDTTKFLVEKLTRTLGIANPTRFPFVGFQPKWLGVPGVKNGANRSMPVGIKN